MYNLKRIPLLLALMVLFVQCDEFKGEQEIPAYVKIEGFNLVENPELGIPQEEDFLTSDIRDVWVYVDNDFVGAFPLPCSVPILKQGRHKVDIRPGVLYNGMHATREAYPFYTTIVDTLDLVPGKEIVFPRKDIMYNAEKSQFPNLYELFEDPYPNFQLATNAAEETEKMAMVVSSDSVRYGNACGAIYYNSNGKNKYITIDSIYCTNKNGTVLEIDYHSNIPFEVGVYGKRTTASASEYVSAIRLNPNAEKGWQKVYVLLNKVWGMLDYPVYYKFYFEAFNPEEKTNTFIHIDNVKVVHYPNQY